MPIRKRGERWQVDVAFQGLRKQEQAPDEVTAKRRELEILGELKLQSEGKESKRWTLETGVTKTHQLAWKGTAAEETTMKTAVRMQRFFGKGTLLSEITTDWVDLWVQEMEERGNSNGTINRQLACLSKVLSVAIERGVIDKKPHLGRKTESLGRIRWLTLEEERAILGLYVTWGKLDHKDATVFLLDTGCRPSEAWNLTSRDVDFQTGMLSFWLTKNGTSRSVPMTLRVRAIMERRTKDAVRPFPFSNDWYLNTWNRMKSHLHLTQDIQFVPYCLRHTCASRLAQRGVHLAVIKAWMGHKTLQITMRYAHLCPADLQPGARALEQLQDTPMSSSG